MTAVAAIIVVSKPYINRMRGLGIVWIEEATGRICGYKVAFAATDTMSCRSVFMTAIGFATAVMPLGTAIALFSTLAHGLMIIMLLLLPETRGRVIASLEQEAPGATAYSSRSAVGCS
jgi:hypothetical protein